MSKLVGIGDLSGAVSQILEEYGEAADKLVQQAAPKVAKSARAALASASPSRTGRYAGGWNVHTETRAHGIKVTVHNKTKPGLTHLLENGHANRDGGRTAARPHIEAVNDQAQQEFLELIERGLGTL